MLVLEEVRVKSHADWTCRVHLVSTWFVMSKRYALGQQGGEHGMRMGSAWDQDRGPSGDQQGTNGGSLGDQHGIRMGSAWDQLGISWGSAGNQQGINRGSAWDQHGISWGSAGDQLGISRGSAGDQQVLSLLVVMDPVFEWPALA